MEWECHSCGLAHETVPDRCRSCGAIPEVVLNLWRCQHCGTEEIPGTATSCPSCKAPKDIEVESRVDASSRLEGKRALELARGRWLYCAFCDVEVPPVDEQGQSHESCPNCRGPLSEATKEAAVQSHTAEQAAQYRRLATKEKGAAPQAPAPSPRAKRPLWLFVLVGVLLFAGIYFIFFHSYQREFTVTKRSWRRTIVIEAYGQVHEENWESSLPAEAFNRRCSAKIHHHDQIPNGTETYTDKVSAGRQCAAHGYKTKGGVSVKQCTRWETKYKNVTKTRTRYKQVPVRRPFCQYDINKWHPAREVVAQGEGQEAPRWPAPKKLIPNKERQGKRIESYTLVLTKNGESSISYPCPSQGEWEQFPLMSHARAEVSARGKIKQLSPVK